MCAITCLMLLTVCFSCNSIKDKKESAEKEKPQFAINKRPDGTLKSISQVDSMGLVNGNRITYYEDGKTVYSKIVYQQGLRNGPAGYYYRNGQIAESSYYVNGDKHGVTKKYYENGKPLAVYEHVNGNASPGLREYAKDGALISSYPDVSFKEVNNLASNSRIDLEIRSTIPSNKINYFLLEEKNGLKSRIPLISDHGSFTRHFYVRPGESINQSLEFILEYRTELGNIYAKQYSYTLSATNPL